MLFGVSKEWQRRTIPTLTLIVHLNNSVTRLYLSQASLDCLGVEQGSAITLPTRLLHCLLQQTVDFPLLNLVAITGIEVRLGVGF